jgi:hypothetical protein
VGWPLTGLWKSTFVLAWKVCASSSISAPEGEFVLATPLLRLRAPVLAAAAAVWCVAGRCGCRRSW